MRPGHEEFELFELEDRFIWVHPKNIGLGC